jgi:hypothetical protein
MYSARKGLKRSKNVSCLKFLQKLLSYLTDFLCGLGVRRFDAELIPLHGASGLLGRVERLLDKTPVRHVGAREKDELLDDLVKIVHETE